MLMYLYGSDAHGGVNNPKNSSLPIRMFEGK